MFGKIYQFKLLTLMCFYVRKKETCQIKKENANLLIWFVQNFLVQWYL